MPGPYGVASEVGRLRKVIVPGIGHLDVIPTGGDRDQRAATA